MLLEIFNISWLEKKTCFKIFKNITWFEKEYAFRDFKTYLNWTEKMLLEIFNLTWLGKENKFKGFKYNFIKENIGN